MSDPKRFRRDRRNVDARVWRGDIPMGHTYTMGVAGEEFFQRLRDAAEITATLHEGAEEPLLPPRLYHPETLAPVAEWVRVGPGGAVDSFTILEHDADGLPYPEPRVLALIRIDGARGGLLHWIGGCEAKEVKIGMRVRAVFEPKSQRRGGLADIRHFEPAGR